MIKKWTKFIVIVCTAIGAICGLTIMFTKNDQRITGDKNFPIQISGSNISGSNIQVKISQLASDDKGIVENLDEENKFIDIDAINTYKFQALWSTNIGIYDGGNRDSYLALLDMKENNDNPTIRKLASSAIKTIENAYDGSSNLYVMRTSIERWGFICRLSVPPCANGFEPPESYNVKNVFDHLGYKKWQERARAACLLRYMDSPTNTDRDKVTKKEVCDKLIVLMGPEENSLFVSKMALETYKDLTGFSSSGVFDFDKAIEDWLQRKINFKG